MWQCRLADRWSVLLSLALLVVACGTGSVRGQEAVAVAIEEENSFGLLGQVSAVARGRTQLECGYTFLHDRDGPLGFSQHAYPDLLLRWGLTQRLELRLGWPGYVSARAEDRSTGSVFTGSDRIDPNVGFMWDVFPADGWRPQTAVLAAVPISLSGNAFAFDSLQPLASVLYSWPLTDRLTLVGATGLARFRPDSDTYYQFQQSLSLDMLLGDRLAVFGQAEMLTDIQSADNGSQYLLTTGCSYLWSERWSSEVRVGMGLNERAPDFLAGVRVAMRF